MIVNTPNSDRAPSLHGNATKRWVTATRGLTLLGLLQGYFKKGNIDVLGLIESGGVWFNRQRLMDPNHWVAAQETVMVYQSPTQSWHYGVTPESMLYRHDGVLVVFKPSGLSTVPDRACHRYNLTHAVGVAQRHDGYAFAPTAITRLDLMVSGLVLFGSTPDAEKALFALMRAHAIRKQYTVTIPCVGVPPRFRRIRCLMSFNGRAYESVDGKPSITWFFLRQVHDGMATYTAIPITGKRHQIRYHSTRLMGPIVGDDWYGSTHRSVNGLALRCVRLRFPWQGRSIDIHCPDALHGVGWPPTHSVVS